MEAGSFEEKRALLGLADVLFAYAYDHRTTTGDATVESAWTVAVLSPLLSWLEVGGWVLAWGGLEGGWVCLFFQYRQL